MSSTTSDALREVLGADPVPAQLDSLRNESREFTVASVFAGIIATLALWPAVVHDSLLVWAALAVSWSLLREVFMHFYAARVPQRALSVALVVPAAVAGAIWGVLPLLFFDAQNVATSVFLVLVVVSLSAVSLIWLSALKSVYFAFATPALLSLVWVLFAARFLVAGILTVTVLALALYLAYKLDRALRHSAGLLERNNELNAQLQAGGTGIREARKAVERASTAKAEFLAAAGLGLRQRLYAMNLLIDSVRSSSDETERQSAIDRIDQSFQGLDAAFESLLDMSRLEAKRVPADQQSFHLRDVIMPLRGAWEALAASQGLTFRSRVLDAVLRSDPRLLQRIIRHLVNNALMHTTQGGVLLATRLRPAEVWIEVWDTGPGIADDQQDQVFQEYFKIEPADGSRSPGLGLGLAIVQRLCRLLKHPVEIHSRPDRGSLFRVRVPRGSPRALRDSLWSDDYPEMQMQGNTILILDGKRAMLEALEPVLRRWGCSVWPALSGEEALSLVQMEAVRPDAVICDSQLRGEESGLDVINALRKHLGDNIPVLMTAGEERLASLTKLAKRARVEVLSKPVQPQQLRAALLRMLIEAAEGEAPQEIAANRQADV